MDRSPGGVGDGLAALPSGEPVLPRFFAIAMVILVPIGFAVTAWAFLSIESETISPAARRPPGTAEVTHDRGQAALTETLDTEPGPQCAADLTLVGDEGSRATLRRALSSMCASIDRDEDTYALVAEGLRIATIERATLRMGVFELTGVDASTRIENARPVIELNAKFQFGDGTKGAPMLAAEFVHFATGWPIAAVSAEDQLEALQIQALLCEPLLGNDPPRGCFDAQLVVDDPEAIAALVEAGYVQETP